MALCSSIDARVSKVLIGGLLVLAGFTSKHYLALLVGCVWLVAMVPPVLPPWSGPGHTAQQVRLQMQRSQLILLAEKQASFQVIENLKQ